MASETIRPARNFRGRPKIPGDKSISHRGLIFGALAKGASEVVDILDSEDVQSTARCLRALGVAIATEGRRTLITSPGRSALEQPTATLDCGNSGTTIRLLMGMLAGGALDVRLTGDASLVKRPMRRVAEPLQRMGARFELSADNFAPLRVRGTQLHGISYELKVASAQIKSAIILAALAAAGATEITGEIASRDHTERLLGHYGARVEASPTMIRIPGGQNLHGASLQVPGDPSTAAFWMAAASLIPGAELDLENILLNPTRTGFLRVLQRMGVVVGAHATTHEPEPIGKISVRPQALRGFKISRAEVPSLIDEIPMLAVLATQAQGESVIEGAEELRVKESDRLEAIATNLRAMGAVIDVREDGFSIVGPQKLRGASIQTFHDHRIAMAFSVAGLVAEGETVINNSECACVSYPQFFVHLRELTAHA